MMKLELMASSSLVCMSTRCGKLNAQGTQYVYEFKAFDRSVDAADDGELDDGYNRNHNQPSARTLDPHPRSPLTAHRSPLTAHRSPFTVHRSPFTVHPHPHPHPGESDDGYEGDFAEGGSDPFAPPVHSQTARIEMLVHTHARACTNMHAQICMHRHHGACALPDGSHRDVGKRAQVRVG